MTEKFHCVVIGSGPGGYSAAIRCAQRGATTAIIEKDLIGGVCLNCGCIPSKTLLASAHTLLTAKNAAVMGINAANVSPDWPKIQSRKDAIVAGFRKGLTGLIQANKIKIFNGRGIITSPGQVKVESSAGETLIQADRTILATGSEPIEIPAFPFDGQTIISSKEALTLQQIPASMVIVGGGVIGCEMACAYAAMGTKITIVEALTRLIPMEDAWVGQLLAKELKKLGIESLTSQKVTGVEKTGQSAKVVLESGQTVEAEKVLVSVGRRATIDKETIDALGLQMNGKVVAVDKKLRTNVINTYALGDVVGTTYLAHGAFAEAEVAAINATGGSAEFGDYDLVPRAVYTFPEIASVGKSEEACKAEGLEVSVGRSFFKANARSAAHGEIIGEIRVVKEKSNNTILGITMVGAMVTELISAARVLLGTKEKITDISFPHPTVSEVLKEAAEDAFGMSLHNPPKAR
jgi:dihydrolipoamide dehydrogenase